MAASDYSSNCPVSRPVPSDIRGPWEDVGGLAWSDEIGLFFPTETELLPIRRPHQRRIQG